ncbi:BrnT family toxin [Candidatus Poribacteria bacterium]|nr:BrnT family toxin [Candidatus Poribacteria bacterium]
MPPPEGFEWDEPKNQENISRRGISFQQAAKIFQGDILEWEDTREDYGEARMIVIGRSERHLLRVIYTQRGNRTRIISARKADKNDRRKYYNAFLR